MDVIVDPSVDSYVQGLKSELEKSSPSLGRSAVYTKDSRINDLPRYYILNNLLYIFWSPAMLCKSLHIVTLNGYIFVIVYDSTFLPESSAFCKLTNPCAVNNRYLTVQFVRFFWKRESNQKAKILRVIVLSP